MSLSRAVVPLQRVGCACGGEIGADGQCADCRARRERVQRKMSVNPPGDALEQEADQVARAHIQRQAAEEPSAAPEMPVQRRMADKDAMSVQRRAADEHMPTQRQAAEPETPVQLKTADEETKPVQRQATEPETPVQRRTADEETKPVQPQAAEPEKPVQRQATEPETPVQRQTADEEATVPVQRAGGASVPEVTPAVESGIQGARGGGSALPPSVQRSMEDTMGADLSSVRVHNDGNQALSFSVRVVGLTADAPASSVPWAPLAPGDALDVEVDVTVPESMTPGDHSVAIEVMVTARAIERTDNPRVAAASASTSRAKPTVAMAPLVVKVASLDQVVLRTSPTVVRGRRGGKFSLEVINKRHDDVVVDLAAEGASLQVDIEPRTVTVAAGDAVTVFGRVRAPRLWRGDERQHVVNVEGGGSAVPTYTRFVFRQRPVIARGIRGFAAVFVVLA
ncbi:MAG: DUF4157 domain-containing protein, partial [Candidatus Promineofilum sp.]|nr:DUF4157 domain-containing protein [Promineifilum sp.]